MTNNTLISLLVACILRYIYKYAILNDEEMALDACRLLRVT